MTTKTTQYNGVPGLNRALAALPKEASAKLRDASVDIATDVAAEARRRAYQTGGVAFLVAPYIVAVRDRVPKVRMGAGAKLPTSGSRGQRSRSGPGQTIGDVIYGAEFGGEQRPSTQQFGPHLGQTGYFLWPTIRAQSDAIGERYSLALHEALVAI